MTSSKASNYRGIDPKSIMLNFASFMLFAVPFVLYFKAEYGVPFCKATVASFAVAYITSPMGWLRPHPYSDLPGNKPIGYRN
jgi:hypothetical protein